MNWNFDEKHLEIARVLVDMAKEEHIIYYADLRMKVGMAENEMRKMWGYLGDLSSFCDYYEMPLISAMVINQKKLRPGDNFYKAIYSEFRGIDVSNEDEKYEEFKKEWELIKEYGNWDRLIELLEEEIFPTPKLIKIKRRPKWLGKLNIDKSNDEEIEFIEIDEFIDIEEVAIEEGKYIEKVIEAKKRNPKVRKMKIEQFKKDNDGKVFCEVCNEDDIVVLDVHHDKVEVCDMEEGHKTKLSDLRLLCSNCHRKVHGHKITVEELIKGK